MEFKHIPIMLEECIENLNIKPNGIYVDGTLGGGGHSSNILSKLSHEGVLIAIDQDVEAINYTKERFKEINKRKIFVNDNFSNIREIVEQQKIKKVDGILLDLGVSSYQLDNPDRGFSYQHDAPLDMRMDTSKNLTAEIVVNEYTKEEIANILYLYGEERCAKRIADNICNKRKKQKIKTTKELVDIIKEAMPKGAKDEKQHPAKRTFQAIRIEVNNELGVLRKVIEDAKDILNNKGRICIITFHSLEDRIVKQAFNNMEGKCTCPPDFPICICNKKCYGKNLTKKPIIPNNNEIEENPRSRSAKLRVFERQEI